MKKLRTRRVKAQLSQIELAKKSGVTQGAISHYERGARDPSLTSLRKLAKALECQLHDLV